MARPSRTMLHVLRLVAAGRDPYHVPLVDGLGSQSRTAGRAMTVSACRRHGFLNLDDGLTDKGRAAIQEPTNDR
jgi:xanthine/CO dehydrogenase XdhC/CoxF family maturation factor